MAWNITNHLIQRLARAQLFLHTGVLRKVDIQLKKLRPRAIVKKTHKPIQIVCRHVD